MRKALRAVGEWFVCLVVVILVMLALPIACLWFMLCGIEHPLRAFCGLLDDLSRNYGDD